MQRITRLVSEGTSVEVVGARGSGRSELLNQVRRVLDSLGLTVLMVRGVGADIPLEPIRSALPAPTTQDRYLVAIGAVTARLTELLAEGAAVVLVDDADLLDNASWAALESAHKQVGTPIVATTRARAPMELSERLLFHIAEPVIKIPLTGLKPEVLHELLETHLQGPIAPSLTGRVHTQSSGLPGLALAIVDAGASHGLLSRSGSVWRDGPELWSNDLNGVYEALLFTYPSEIREAVHVLALVGPVPVQRAARLVGQTKIELLEGLGLVRLFIAGARHLVSVNPPGITDYFRHQPPTIQRLRLLDHVESVLGRAVNIHDQSVIEYRSATGHEELPLIARMFSESYRLELSQAWESWDRSGDAPTAVALLRLLLNGQPNSDQLRLVAEGTSLAGASADMELEFRFLRSRWLMMDGQPFERVVEAMTPDSGFELADGLHALLIGLRSERFGIPDDVELQLAPLVESDGLGGQIARAVLAAIRVLAGHAEEALDLLDSSYFTRLSSVAKMIRGLALLGSGRIVEAMQWSTTHVDSAIANVDRAGLVAHSYVLVLSRLILGRFDEAAEAGNLIISTSTSAGVLLFPPDRALIHALAVSATKIGRTMAAETLRERAESYPERSVALPLGSPQFVDAAITAQEGKPAAAAADYHRIADDLRMHRFIFAADGATLLGLVTEYDPIRATDFRARAIRTDGALFAAYLDARAAIHDENPDLLRTAALTLFAEQATGQALMHLSYAGRLYRDLGLIEKANSVRRELHEIMASDNTMTATEASQIESSWGLTGREREIILDVAAGLNNSSIATKYRVSTRTVETHMRNIRSKTGAVKRSEIAMFANPA